MKPNVMLTVTSLLAILFMTLHLTDDVLRGQGGMGQGGFEALLVVLILIVWLYAVLVLAERRWGIFINLVGSLLASYIAFGHLTGVGDVTVGEISKSSPPLFVWAVIALGVTAIFSVVLAARALWAPVTGPAVERPVARRK